MRVRKVSSNDVKLYDLTQVKLKTAGNTQVVQFTAGNNKSCPVRNLSKDEYFDKKTGEVKEKNKSENRHQVPKSVRKSINRLMDLIRCNATDPVRCKWITVTYEAVMTDGKQAFLDAKLFLRRLKRYLAKQIDLTASQKSFQYITVAEPQGEKHGNSWHLHILLIFEDTAPFIEIGETIISNTYNAAGYRVAKEVSKNGRSTKTYFLYDGNHVIMEADKDGITAKNTYGGPLLLRTVYGEDDAEETYQYLYNAHGDVVTLLADGEVAATYCYDSFGNIESQTGDVDNSVLYAGYQYDEETGLYYINARMYDPVTARFLQRDTYAGNIYDPLSLNLYTYCLNNPHKYVDPSGHFVITAALILMAVRIGISVVSGVVSAKAEYDRQVAEGDNYTNRCRCGNRKAAGNRNQNHKP